MSEDVSGKVTKNTIRIKLYNILGDTNTGITREYKIYRTRRLRGDGMTPNVRRARCSHSALTRGTPLTSVPGLIVKRNKSLKM